MLIALEALIGVLAIWLVWLAVRRLLRPSAPTDPVDDLFASVPSPRKRGPTGRMGAVAVEEPEDDGDTNFFPPRKL